MDKRAEIRTAQAALKALRDDYWQAQAVDRTPILTKINEQAAALAALLKPVERARERTEANLLRLTKEEKKRLTSASKRAKVSVSELCRRGGLLEAALILDLPKQQPPSRMKARVRDLDSPKASEDDNT